MSVALTIEAIEKIDVINQVSPPFVVQLSAPLTIE